MAFRCTLRVWLVGFALVLASCAGPKPVAQPPQPKHASVSRSTPGLFLYEVRGSAGSAHLLGTIHVGFGFDEVLTDDARARFAAASRVMTEADVSAADPTLMMQAALLPADRSLSSIVGKPTWERLVARIGEQIPPPILERLEPWLPTVMLGLEELEHALKELRPGAETRLMDVELMKAAKAQGKTLTHFETVAEQIAIFESITLEDQVRELSEALESESSDQARALLSSFAAGDERALGRAIFDATQLERAPVFYQRVLFERNARWLPVIEREAARGGAFIAVGAAHLLGERGILEELRRRGYSVTRVG
jgi:uncharacterized protein YbaP (TraB family)